MNSTRTTRCHARRSAALAAASRVARPSGLTELMQSLEPRVLFSGVSGMDIAAQGMLGFPTFGGIAVHASAPRVGVTSLNAPSGLMTTVKSSNSIQLNWTNNDLNATAYYIYRSLDGGKTVTFLAKIASGAVSTYTDNTALPLHTYTYDVLANAGAVFSPASNAVTGSTPLAVPAAFKVAALSPTAIQLAWTDTDPSALGYKIFRSTDGINFSQITTINSGRTLSFLDSTVSSDSTYTYEVQAFNGGNTSALAISPSLTTPLIAPSAFTGSATTGTSIQLNWTDNDSNAAGYYVLRATDGLHFTQLANLANPNAATYTDNSVISGHTYFYEVQAYNGAVVSVVAPKVAVNTPLAAPSGLTTTVKSAIVVQLNWTDNDVDAAGYYILRSTDGVKYTQIAKLTGAAANAYIDTPTLPFHNYSYEIVAYAGAINSVASNVATAATPLAVPATFKLTVQSPAAIQLTWVDTDPAALGYNVFRSTDGVNFSQIGTVNTGATHVYVDSTVATDATYTYEVQAFNGNNTSGLSATAAATTPLFVPTALTGNATSGTSITLNWTDNDSNAAGCYVLRSIDGVHFTQLANLTDPNAATYTDNSVISGHVYYYEVQAYNGAVTSALTPRLNVNTPIAAPSGMTTTIKAPTSVQLNWTDNDTNASAYYVFRSVDGGNTFAYLTKLTGAAVNTFTDNTALPFHNYTYEVLANNGPINSPFSSTAAASTPLAVPGAVKAVAQSPSAVLLAWTDTDPSAQGYTILRSTDGVNFSTLTTINSGKTFLFTDSTVSTDTTYTYQVQAFNGNSTSALSGTASATTPLFVPTGLSGNATSGTSITLNWTDNDSNAAGYYVLRSTDGVKFLQLANLANSTANTYTDNALISGHIYYYEVQAYNGAVTSSVTPRLNVNTPIAAPSGLTTTVKSPTSVQLNWTNNDSNASVYYVFRSIDGGNTFGVLAKLTGAAINTYSDNTALPFHNYTYEVLANNGPINSPFSNTAAASTPLAVPGTVKAVAQSPAAVQLTWTDSDPSALGYTILRSTDGVNFSTLTTINSGKTLSFTDSTVSTDTMYTYEVQAFNGNSTSAVSVMASATTPLFAPTAITATPLTTTSIQLNWTDNDANAAGYYILRSTDGVKFTQLANLTSGNAATYTDSTVLSGHVYYYELQAYNGAVTSALTAKLTTNTPLAAPSSLVTTVKSATSVQLNWTDNDTNAAGYVVLRSADGINYTQIAKIAGALVNTYTDAAALSGYVYQYKVQAYAGTITSSATSPAAATTPLVSPGNVAINFTGAWLNLTWANKDANGAGYLVFRSTDGVTFSQVAQINSVSTTNYLDNTVVAGQTYYYYVQAVNTVAASANSVTVSSMAPVLDPSGHISITTRFGNELVVTATGPNDSISVSQSGGTLTILADGQSFSESLPAAGLFIYTRGGADTLSVDSSVTLRTTIDTIDGASTIINSAGTSVSIWDDSTDSFSGTGVLHSIASFAGNVTKTLGAALANPTDGGTTFKVNLSLWGTGPAVNDVNQGSAGDCYFLSSLAAFANTNSATLQEAALDMGDGTYAVRFYNNGTPVYVRVSNDIPSGGFNGYRFDHPGANNTIWSVIMEKAFCYFRTGANSYASINSGWMGSVYANLNVNSTWYVPNTVSDTTLYNNLTTALNNGKPVTFGTQNAPNLVSGHAYSLISCFKDVNGVSHYVVRNPWGTSGDALEDSHGYATLTYAQLIANFVDVCIAT